MGCSKYNIIKKTFRHHDYLLTDSIQLIFHAFLQSEHDEIIASTAFHAQELGFRTILVDDCSRGINSADIEKTKEKIRENNGCVIHSSEVRYLWFRHVISKFYLSIVRLYIVIIAITNIFNFKYQGKIDGARQGSSS